MFYSNNSNLNVMCVCFNSTIWQNCVWLCWSWIHCVSSDGYIAYFNLLWISIVFCAKCGYIGSFELNWICIVFCYISGFIDFFNRNNRTCIGFNYLSDVWTKHENACFDLVRWIMKTLVFFLSFVYFQFCYLIYHCMTQFGTRLR